MSATPKADEPPPEPRGIECPNCGCCDLRVWSTRKQPCGRILRVRICRHCDRRVPTWEQPVGQLPTKE